jgi:acetolactate synthase-1/2/3 large subunit
MADATSRLSSGERLGVFAMQSGPGAENAFGGVAQAYAESVPILVLPMGYPRPMTYVAPNFNSSLNYRHIAKSVEQVVSGAYLSDAMRRAFTQLRNGRPRPVLVEIPADVFQEEIPDPVDYRPTFATRTGPDPDAVREAAHVLLSAKQPVIYAGQGIHYARAWQALLELAELLDIPVATSLPGKSAFPENHPLSLGSGGRSYSEAVHEFLNRSDVIFGIGCSFTTTNFGVPIPKNKIVIHATLDPSDLNKDIRADYGLIGDAKLTLQALISEVNRSIGDKKARRAPKLASTIKGIQDAWLGQWTPKLTSNEVPLSPYRVLWDIFHSVDPGNTIITHDAGSPRDQLSPFWLSTAPLTYIGWGKSTQLGYGLGLAMGAKLAQPNKLCINVMGDAAIGETGMDFETASREHIPIVTVLLNNFCMAIELDRMPEATRKYRSTDISGNYAELAKALGGYGERVTEPVEIIPAFRRAVNQTEQGRPALLEFITAKETDFSCHK